MLSGSFGRILYTVSLQERKSVLDLNSDPWKALWRSPLSPAEGLGVGDLGLIFGPGLYLYWYPLGFYLLEHYFLWSYVQSCLDSFVQVSLIVRMCSFMVT